MLDETFSMIFKHHEPCRSHFNINFFSKNFQFLINFEVLFHPLLVRSPGKWSLCIIFLTYFLAKLSTQNITTLQQCRDAITAIVDDVRAHPEMVINVFRGLRVSFEL